jgi:hypothetical protein
MSILFAVLALPWIWIAAIIALILIDVVLAENEKYGIGAAISIAGVAAIAWFGGGVNPAFWLWANLAFVLKLIAGYIAAGASWSILKWILYLYDLRGDLKEQGITKRPPRSYAKNNKHKIVGWIAHWPASIIGTVIGEFLVKLWNRIYRILSNVYKAIEDRMFAGWEEE